MKKFDSEMKRKYCNALVSGSDWFDWWKKWRSKIHSSPYTVESNTILSLLALLFFFMFLNRVLYLYLFL